MTWSIVSLFADIIGLRATPKLWGLSKIVFFIVLLTSSNLLDHQYCLLSFIVYTVILIVQFRDQYKQDFRALVMFK